MDARYFDVVAQVDAEFERNRKLHGERIRCGQGCTDCCRHRFQITATEASAIQDGMRRLPLWVRRQLASRAAEYLRETAPRAPCPALHEGSCLIYEHRPLICRKFGMPIYNPEKPERILACELNFRAGEEIRDPDLIRIQTGIHVAWSAIRDTARLTVAEAVLQAANTD